MIKLACPNPHCAHVLQLASAMKILNRVFPCPACGQHVELWFYDQGPEPCHFFLSSAKPHPEKTP